MQNHDEFDISDANATFDFKGFLFKLLSYWKVILLCIAFALGIAYYINVRKLDIYSMSNLVSIKDDQNPFFTSTTSLTFNWGGTSDKVNGALIVLRSREHNEAVVDSLQFYINYEKEGEYQREDVYGYTPFKVRIDTTAYQLYNTEMRIQTKNDSVFELSVKFPEDRRLNLFHYGKKRDSIISIDKLNFVRDFKFGNPIRLPFFEGTFFRTEKTLQENTPFYVSLSSVDATVSRYKNVKVAPESNGSSVLNMSLTGTNKPRLVDYLNTTVAVLSKDLLERKNLFATKTITFIERQLNEQGEQLQDVEDELNAFRIRNAIIDIDSESSELSQRTATLDASIETINRQLDYLKTLQNYLTTRTDYSNVPAPSVAGIAEGSIVALVANITALAEERSRYQYAYKEKHPIFEDIDRRIDAAKSVLTENIRSSKSLLERELNRAKEELGSYESKIRKLPKEQQDLLKIQRRYDLNEASYNLFLSKLNEARLVKAANVSDVVMVDKAKDTGAGRIGPNTRLNYVIALLFGGLIPFTIIFIKVFFDNSIHTTEELQKLTPLPFLGVIGKNDSNNNLTVLDSPRSAISESFRALRSSLQFMYRKQGVEGAKTVLISSSVSGEGKTFCSMNLASVFALSERKTVLVGLDLRKPKIFDDFNIDNTTGVVNYLIGQNGLQDIIQKTRIPHLDIITSGPLPPNPSELMMKDTMDDLMTELKNTYDYIVLDSPPIGLVTDAMSLIKYADTSIYIVRQGLTKKGMLHNVNQKYKTGELQNISIVLNYFEQKAKYGYGYNYGYGAYGKGYGETQKKKPWYKRIVSRK